MYILNVFCIIFCIFLGLAEKLIKKEDLCDELYAPKLLKVLARVKKLIQSLKCVK